MATENNSTPFTTSNQTLQSLLRNLGLGLSWAAMGSKYGLPTTTVLYSTAIVVGTTVGVIDLLQRISTMKHKDGTPCETWENAIRTYYNDNHFMDSGLTILRTYTMVSSWTGGYEILSKYFGSQSFQDMLLRAVGAATVSSLASVTLEETLTIIQNDIYKNCLTKDETPESWGDFFKRHLASFLIFPDALTSFVASLLVDINITHVIETKIGNSPLEKIVAKVLGMSAFAVINATVYGLSDTATQGCLSWFSSAKKQSDQSPSLEQVSTLENPENIQEIQSQEESEDEQDNRWRCGIM